MLTFNRRYFLYTTILFLVEVLIALFMRDRFVRPYGGDYLVVIMVYCAGRTFIQAAPWKMALGVLGFAYAIEVLQYFRLVDWLGWSENTLAKTVIGYGFAWWDLLAYTLGIATVLALERSKKKLTAKGYV